MNGSAVIFVRGSGGFSDRYYCAVCKDKEHPMHQGLTGGTMSMPFLICTNPSCSEHGKQQSYPVMPTVYL